MFPVDTDPHFIIYVPTKEDSLCFNINEEPGVILNLVQDPDTGMVGIYLLLPSLVKQKLLG